MKLPDIMRRILSWRFSQTENQNENMTKLVDAYQALANTEVGQIVLNDLLQATGVEGDPYEEGNPHGTSRNVGMQRVGLRILSFLGTDRGQYIILEKEMRDDRTKEDSPAETGKATAAL